jgi:hypothetical protein
VSVSVGQNFNQLTHCNEKKPITLAGIVLVPGSLYLKK